MTNAIEYNAENTSSCVKMPLVSVVMSVMNGERFLKESIESVLEQSYHNFEFIIVNDGSTDSSEEIIKSYNDNRIVYLLNETNMKLPYSLNRGISAAKGDYIMRMDCDDVCEKNRMERQVRFMLKHPDIDVLGSWTRWIDEEGKIIGHGHGETRAEIVACQTLFTCPLWHPSVMAKRQVLLDNPYWEKATSGQDMNLWTRLVRKGYRLTNMPEELLRYRMLPDSVSHNVSTRRKDIERKTICDNVTHFLGREVSDEELHLHRLSYQLYYVGAKTESVINDNDFAEEKRWLEMLWHRNNETCHFSRLDFASILFSRWIVCCKAIKQWGKVCSIKLPYYNPVVLWRTFVLLYHKR